MSKIEDIKPKKSATIKLGGEDRTLKFDMNAFAELEKIYGSIEGALKSLENGRMTDVRNLLWAGLIHDQAILDDQDEVVGYKVSKHKVGSWIENISMLKDLSTSLTTALTDDMPQLTEEEATQALAQAEVKN